MGCYIYIVAALPFREHDRPIYKAALLINEQRATTMEIVWGCYIYIVAALQYRQHNRL